MILLLLYKNKRRNKMFKKIVFILFLTLLSMPACDFLENNNSSNEINDEMTLNDESVVCSVSCSELPYSKLITYEDPTIIIISGYPDSFNQQLSDISKGSKSYTYQDSCYKGTLKSISFNMLAPPTIIGDNFLTCKIKITYSGIIYKTAAIDPCYDLPSSKFITYESPATITISGYPDSFNQQLSDISNGYKSYYYKDSCYKGTLKSISFNMLAPPTITGDNYLICNIKITYSGIVYK
jgi:hypothetical protein